MAVSCIGYMVYIVCNFYPEFYTLIPAGVIAGCAAGTLWSAKAQYITVSALEYAKITNKNKDAVIGIDENSNYSLRSDLGYFLSSESVLFWNILLHLSIDTNFRKSYFINSSRWRATVIR